MPCDFAKYAGERADAELGVSRDGDVVFAMLLRGQAQVAAGLARDRLPEGAQALLAPGRTDRAATSRRRAATPR